MSNEQANNRINTGVEAAVQKFIDRGSLLPVVDGSYIVMPGFCDVHVHFREPGYCYKETIATGSKAAAHGGYTAVCTMPNLNPVPDCPGRLKVQLDAIEKDAVIPVFPYGAITRDEKGGSLSDMRGIADSVCAFSDDGRGVENELIMRNAMVEAKKLGKIIAAHCEDITLVNGGYIHDGSYARAHGHKTISSESEFIQVRRDLRLAKETECSYHVCHISTKESVDLIRKAKAEGVDVTCETAPHYLTLCQDDLREDGRFKMNPPLRSREDKEALIEGIQDGTIDMIATDHAPHSQDEKSRGLKFSRMGVVGLETAFPVLYTKLVRSGIISIERLTELMSLMPRKRFGITSDIGYTLFEIDKPYIINPRDFCSKGKSTPFAGSMVYGKWLRTCVNGKVFE